MLVSVHDDYLADISNMGGGNQEEFITVIIIQVVVEKCDYTIYENAKKGAALIMTDCFYEQALALIRTDCLGYRSHWWNPDLQIT